MLSPCPEKARPRCSVFVVLVLLHCSKSTFHAQWAHNRQRTGEVESYHENSGRQNSIKSDLCTQVRQKYDLSVLVIAHNKKEPFKHHILNLIFTLVDFPTSKLCLLICAKYPNRYFILTLSMKKNHSSFSIVLIKFCSGKKNMIN